MQTHGLASMYARSRRPDQQQSNPSLVQPERGYDHDKHRRPLYVAGIATQSTRRGEPHGSGQGNARWGVDRTLGCRMTFDDRASTFSACLSTTKPFSISPAASSAGDT